MITITISDSKEKDKEEYDNNSEEEEEGEEEGEGEEEEEEEGEEGEEEREDIIMEEEEKKDLLDTCNNMIHNVTNFKNIIDMGQFYYDNKKKIKLVLDEESVDFFRKCYKIKPYVLQLTQMVGLESCKKTIFLQMSYFLQGLHENKLDMLHMVISGQPGVGKTQLAQIIGKLYSKLGILKYGQFIHAKRSDLIGQHLGETSIKTSNVIDDAYGGILFIDEAYALGNEEKRDIFSKECIDTINQALTEQKDSFMLIIAGYKQSLLDCFFNYNPGLKRRFNFWIHIPNYNARQLHQIFVEKFELNSDHSEWHICTPVKRNAPLAFFSKNYNSFKNFGGDIESLIFYIKLFHSTNIKKNKKKKTDLYF